MQPYNAETFQLLTEAEFYRLPPDKRSAYVRYVVGELGLIERFKPEPDAE